MGRDGSVFEGQACASIDVEADEETPKPNVG